MEAKTSPHQHAPRKRNSSDLSLPAPPIVSLDAVSAHPTTILFYHSVGKSDIKTRIGNGVS